MNAAMRRHLAARLAGYACAAAAFLGCGDGVETWDVSCKRDCTTFNIAWPVRTEWRLTSRILVLEPSGNPGLMRCCGTEYRHAICERGNTRSLTGIVYDNTFDWTDHESVCSGPTHTVHIDTHGVSMPVLVVVQQPLGGVITNCTFATLPGVVDVPARVYGDDPHLYFPDGGSRLCDAGPESPPLWENWDTWDGGNP
ncbi:MAG: hypothetical protein HY904_15530 [Deltaproteobacteria bacterium]|nr:hypothetical protein [Deltaproteobacteria bacterium]